MGSWYPIVATPNRQPVQWSKTQESHPVYSTQFGNCKQKPELPACFDDSSNLHPFFTGGFPNQSLFVGLQVRRICVPDRRFKQCSTSPESLGAGFFFRKFGRCFRVTNLKLGGGNSNICQFHPGSFVKWSNLSDSYFSNGLKRWNHQLVNHARQKYEEASKFMHLFLRVDWAGKSLEWPHRNSCGRECNFLWGI